MEKKILEGLDDWSMVLVSENPLTIKSKDEEEGELFIGIPAQVIIRELKEELAEEEAADFDMKDLNKLKPEQKLLVTANLDYADEFDMNDFCVYNVEGFKEVVKDLKAYKDEIEWYFGTNEEMRFSDGEDLLSNFDVRPITDDEAEVLDRLFGGEFDNSGVFGRMYDAMENEDDYDEDEEEQTYSKSTLKHMEYLKENGWTITIDKEDEYMVTVEKGENKAVCSIYQLDELVTFLKKNK
jgi:hypothetical protein